MNNHRVHRRDESGIALLITLLIMTVLLGVSASILNITLKQFQFSSIGLASEVAFQAANAGMECMLYHDYENYPTSKFDIGQNKPSIQCMGASDSIGGNAQITSGTEQKFQFEWGSPLVCTEMSIFKYFDASNPVDMFNSLRRTGNCAAGVTCTVIQSRGYNVACTSVGTARTIERELTMRY